MKFVLFPFSMLLLFSFANAQFKTLGQSQIFRQEEGMVYLSAMENGFTFVMQHPQGKGKKHHIEIYDQRYKKVTEKDISPSYINQKDFYIREINKVNNDIVVLAGFSENKIEQIHRTIIDGRTGEIKKEEKLAELKPTGKMDGAAQFWANVPRPAFYCKFSPNGNYYALVTMNSFESDRNKRIEIQLYNKEHKEISRAFYVSPEDRFKYMRYISMCVMDEGKIYLFAEAHNTKSSGGKESQLVLASLEEGKNAVDLKIVKGIARPEAIMRLTVKYNPEAQMLLVYARRFGATGWLSYINPATGEVKKEIDFGKGLEDSRAKYEERFGKRPRLRVSPQNIFIHQDGSFAVVDEGLEITDDKSPKGRVYNYNTALKDIVIYNYDAAGNYTHCNIMPKNHYIPLVEYHEMYGAGNIESCGTVDDDNRCGQFKSFVYVPVGAKQYVMFNDEDFNEERVKKGRKVDEITKAGDTDPFLFELNKGTTFPQRSFLFGKEGSTHKPVFFDIMNYDAATRTLVMLRQEKGGRNKDCKLVWMQHD